MPSSSMFSTVAAMHDAVMQAHPEIVVHQLTDLPQVFDPERRGEALRRNARLRIEHG